VEDAHKGVRVVVLQAVPPSVIPAALLGQDRGNATAKSTGEEERHYGAHDDERSDH
jgi:hypothetical protein